MWTYLENQISAEVIKLRSLRLSWVSMGPKSNDKCLEEKMRETEQRTEQNREKMDAEIGAIYL